MTSSHQRLLTTIITLLLALVVVPVWAEERTVKATAAWRAEGDIFKVQDDLALFVGAFGGIMFVETKKGELDAAKLLCPGMLELNLNNGSQSGEGRCIITGQSGDRVYATWQCAGVHLKGCQGNFTLNGGTGKFAKVTGHSTFEIRSDIAAYVASTTGDRVEASASGVAVWPSLTYKTH